MPGLRLRWQRTALFFAVAGPGIITAAVDNDANGVATYSTAGAHFGYALLWTLPVAAVALIVIQEMAARMGAVTGLGLADLLREQLGVRPTAGVMAVLLLANWANTVGDFAGVAGSLEIFRVPRLLGVPLAAVLVAVLVLRGGYRLVERIFLGASALYVLYAISAILARPQWEVVFQAVVVPTWRPGSEYLVLVVALVGTTIAPWMQFYHQAAVVDKGLTANDVRYERADTILGGLVTVLVAGSIIVATATTLFPQGIRVETAEDAARALAPLAGRYASLLFAVGLLNAAVFSVAIIPLSTAYAICEAFGWEAGLDRPLAQAPVFYGLFLTVLAASALVILWPGLPLIPVMVASQALNGILLPVVLVIMLRLVNDRRLMGAHTNGAAGNAVAWATTVLLVGLSLALLLVTVLQGAGGRA
ncbi:MAG: divalent metal cation transporter [Armatimonadota bacterium]|nr:divalent metal cation transporter [Armatimonadota bacterium]MDR7426804.1 divalent metal cation transporter [Armatimonadota bacterium]MDR7463941.1 divalent metal cation transporter [Armatimonadota bacterium]MDR7469894.1 divalent metal cation transporter [Armatimonadota bacterium]MDR7474354.1 divalent metal cation transporter [Armatimonadota bacterium]